ncbi:MAG: WecB/TagA/CpsF family glycosyltransferase, partial [Archangium sp.]|nr:WecB/TagA/CpsF family glycosyltransferase [Archangium sp.]
AVTSSKSSVLGVLVDAVSYETAVERVLEHARARRPFSVSALAVHGVMTGVLDPVHRYRLNHLDLIVPDGQPVRWALNALHGRALERRVYGPLLMLKVCEAAAQAEVPVYFYGSRPEVLERLSANLRARIPGLVVAGQRPSFFRTTTVEERAAALDEIRRSGAGIVFVGLGCPRQEVWAYENTEALSVPVLAVGAAFDFHAGLLSQAPPFMQDRGLEWFYRLLMEPGRLWRRYLYLNPLYLALIALQATGLKKFDPQQNVEPNDDVLVG